MTNKSHAKQSNANLVLNGHQLDLWQRGRRRYAIERLYRYKRWHPTSLLSYLLRYALFRQSQGMPTEEAASRATSGFMTAAKSPGLDCPAGTNTYQLAVDICAQIKTILEYHSRTVLLTLKDHEPVQVSPGLSWSFLSYPDESGVLHKYIFCDAISDDEVMKAFHSWAVIGDIILAKSPMTIHFIAIGQTHNSRRISPWCRAYKSPTVANLIRFQKRSGSALEGDWKPIWLSDNPNSNHAAWVSRMIEDKITEKLVKHMTVREPDQKHIDGFHRDLDYEYNQIMQQEDYLSDPMYFPMCRAACDTPYPCPHQHVCYSLETTLDNSGSYTRIP